MTMAQGRTTDGWMHLMELSVTTTLGNLEEMDTRQKNIRSWETLNLLECLILELDYWSLVTLKYIDPGWEELLMVECIYWS